MSLRVLIVEDEFIIALDLQDQVEALGHRVTGMAGDIETCMRSAIAEPPDVALMDLRLSGGTSGLDASRRLFEELGIRCIFISGNLDDATRETLSAVEPIACIGKPILPHQLRNALERCSRMLDKPAGG